MNYITLINEFWRFYDANRDKISVSDIVMYKVLLRYCNRVGWIENFFIDPFLMAEINPLSSNTYYKSLDNLQELNLIKYKKGKRSISKAQITVLNFKDSVNNRVENSIKYSVKNSVEDSVEDSVKNINKTVIQLNSYTIKQLKEEDFDFLLNSQEFKNYLKENKIEIKKQSGVDFDFSFYKDEFKEIWINEFIPLKKRKKASTSPSQLKKQLEKISNLSGENYEIALQILEKSVNSGWTDFYELKEITQKTKEEQRTAYKEPNTTQIKFINLG